jgi:hypothetical protein
MFTARDEASDPAGLFAAARDPGTGVRWVIQKIQASDAPGVGRETYSHLNET